MRLFKRDEVRLRAEPVVGQASVTDVCDEFYQEFATEHAGRYWWWIRMVLLSPDELIVDDGYDNLYRLPFTVDEGSDLPSVMFGEPAEVRIVYEDVAAGAKSEAVAAAVGGIASVRGQERVAASYEDRTQSAPEGRKNRAESRQPTEGEQMREHIEKLRAKLGLAASATDEEVLAAAATHMESQPSGDPPTADPPAADPPPVDPAPVDPPDDDDDDPVEARGVRVDRDALAQLQADAAAGREARTVQLTSSDEAFIDAAIKKGKFPPKSRASFLSLLKKDREAKSTDTRDYIESLAENTIPVEQRGDSNATEIAAGAHPNLDAFVQTWMPDVAARKAALAAGRTERIMSDQ